MEQDNSKSAKSERGNYCHRNGGLARCSPVLGAAAPNIFFVDLLNFFSPQTASATPATASWSNFGLVGTRIFNSKICILGMVGDRRWEMRRRGSFALATLAHWLARSLINYSPPKTGEKCVVTNAHRRTTNNLSLSQVVTTDGDDLISLSAKANAAAAASPLFYGACLNQFNYRLAASQPRVHESNFLCLWRPAGVGLFSCFISLRR